MLDEIKVKDVIKKHSVDELKPDKKDTVPNDPVVTDEQIDLAISLLRDIENNNGYVAIAQKCSMSVYEVQLVHQFVIEVIAELEEKGSGLGK